MFRDTLPLDRRESAQRVRSLARSLASSVRNRRLVVAVVSVVFAALLVGSAAAVPVGTTLVVSDADTGAVLVSHPVHDGSTVDLAYTHSVQKTPVHDVYTVRGDTLVNTKMTFESYGWGLPARQDVREVNGTLVFDPDWEGRHLYVTPGRVAGHELVVDGHRYDLVALSNASSVRIELTDRSALDAAIDAATHE